MLSGSVFHLEKESEDGTSLIQLARAILSRIASNTFLLTGRTNAHDNEFKTEADRLLNNIDEFPTLLS